MLIFANQHMVSWCPEKHAKGVSKVICQCCTSGKSIFLCDMLDACAGMEEHQLKELAYTIFFGACGKRSNAEHVQVMRAQLEVSCHKLVSMSHTCSLPVSRCD